jgi:hypothetical protein
MFLTWLIVGVALIVVGIVAGLLAGLLGIGGGLVTVPCLYLIFHLLGYQQPFVMHLAIGTSLAAMVFNTASSAWTHHRHGMVFWDIFKGMLLGLILGSVAGAFLAEKLSGVVLEILFGLAAVLLSIRFFLQWDKPEREHPMPHFLVLSGAGFFISAISNILGIGGGIMTFPTLLYFKVGEKKAIGTSAIISFFVTLCGSLSYLYFGLGQTHMPQVIGFIDLPSFIILSVVSFLSAPYGAKLTQKLDAEKLRKIFGVVLFLTGICMLLA